MTTAPAKSRSPEPIAGSAIGRLSVLIPVFNGEASIGPLVEEIVAILRPHFPELEIVLVNDGSMDRSHEAAVDVANKYPGIVKYIRLARNFGEHNAVMCGLRCVTGDCVAIVDDDFQNPPSEILRLVNRLRDGYDVVYSYYDRKRHSWFRNLGSRFNDRVATLLLRKPKDLYLSSFKVLNRFLVQAVVEYTGPYPYIDGLILQSTNRIGQEQCEHAERKTGRSNYTLRKLVSLWLKMFTGFSVVPLRIASLAGFFMSGVGFLLAIFFVVSWSQGGIFLHNAVPPGWASLIVCITIFAGLQLCVLGILGEYVGRLFLTTSRAPQFVIRETIGIDRAAERIGQSAGERGPIQ
jgi:undecaprenyl-phosphate 4-deoxy-4-formamido-L-arabinose transferase